MKYIILISGRRTDYFVKPWRMSLEESIFSPAEDTTLLSSTLSSDSLMLFPANQVINNNDSELDITLKFDRIIRKFMQKWEIKGASFALMKDDRLIYSKGYGFADEEEKRPHGCHACFPDSFYLQVNYCRGYHEVAGRR